MKLDKQQLVIGLRKMAAELRAKSVEVEQDKLVKSAQVITAVRGLQEFRKILTGGIR
jgi:hypothetical protein